MSKRSRWEPKPLLDNNTWSLVPTVGLSIKAGWFIQFGLLIVAAIVYIGLNRAIAEVGFSWFCAAWSLGYLNNRLGGREAQLGVPRIRSDSSFQERLLVDTSAVVIFAMSILALILGADGWRRLLGAQ
jgi:hypothetical protein